MRKLCAFALPFGAAVFLAVYLLPTVAWLPAGLCCAVGGLGGLCCKGAARLRWLLVALGLSAGLVWSWGYHTVRVAPSEGLDGAELPVTATVLDWPYETSMGCGMTVELYTGDGKTVRVLLYAGQEYQTLQPGDSLTLTAKLKRASLRFGEESDYHRSRGVYLLAYAKGEIGVETAEIIALRHWAVYVAHGLKGSIARCFPADAAPLVTALVTGDKGTLSGELYSAIRRTGLAHVVAVSGLHVSFLAGLITTLLGARRRRSAVVGIALMFFFAAVAGGTPSVLRAALMQSFLLLAPLVGREEDKATTLSAVLLLLLLANPYAAASVSLQLSFGAVAGIYLFTGRLYTLWRAKIPPAPKGLPAQIGCGVLTFCAGTLATTLGALVFTTPLMAYYFGTLSLVAPLTNLLTLWAVSGAFLGGLLVAVLGLVLPAVAAVLGLVFALPVRWIIMVAEGLARLPFATVGLDSIYLKLWLLLCYLLLASYLLAGEPRKRPLIPVALSAATLCAALVLTAAGRTGGNVTLSVLDVGQGLSLALYSNGRTALVDCGGSGGNTGDVAADYVQSMGHTKLDLLVLTHCHTDHANGVARLLERLEVGRIILPAAGETEPLQDKIMALAEARGIPVEVMERDGTVSFGGAVLRIYAPLGDGGANEEGLSVLCTSGSFDALITGDMNDVVEKRLVKYGDLPDIEVLVAGHHGSRNASSETLLLATTPEYAIISVGYNSYGHPAPEAMERLAAAGCDIYRTDLMGTVTITANS